MNYTKNTYPISDAASFFSARKGKVKFEDKKTFHVREPHPYTEKKHQDLPGKRMISMEHI